MPTKRENLLALLRGEHPGWVPCSINFHQWFHHHRRFDSLPDELRHTTHYLDAMKVLGCDIFSRNLDGGIRLTPASVQPVKTVEPGPLGPRTTTRYDTPFGSLQSISEEQTAMSSSYQVKDLVTDWDRDGQAYLWLLENRVYDWDEQAYRADEQRLGDDGLVMVPLANTPLKRLHIDFGLDHACLFMLDQPEAAELCCQVYWRSVWPSLLKIAQHPDVHAVILMDNVDTPFYPPLLCERYWTPYVRQAAELLAQHGKRLFVHACGKLHQLRDQFIASGVHGLEGMAHPPLGDFTTDDARSMPRHFIYNGGFTAHEQVTKTDGQVRDFYRDFFRGLRGHDRFIFAAACQTAITTTWDRLKLAVELCRTYGGHPN